MRGLLFLGRVAFICNLFFILCLLIRHTHFTVPQATLEFIIITGWIMSVFFNVMFTIAAIWMLLKKKMLDFPFWLLAFNFICFLIQIVYRIFSE